MAASGEVAIRAASVASADAQSWSARRGASSRERGRGREAEGRGRRGGVRRGRGNCPDPDPIGGEGERRGELRGGEWTKRGSGVCVR